MVSSVVDAKRFPAEPGGSNTMAAPLGPEEALRMVGPFAVVGHHLAPDHGPGGMAVDADVRPHPHIGLSAVTYVLEGHVSHRDSLGNRRELGPGSVGYTVSGRGIVHSERFERNRVLGGARALFQLLLALPDGAEDGDPSFRYVPPEEIPVERADGAVVLWLGHPSAGRGALPFPSATLLADVTLEAGARWSPPEVAERAVFVWAGSVAAGGLRVGSGQVAVLAPGDAVVAAEGARLLAFGGAPVGLRYMWWNYLHSSLERIEAARADWRAGRVTLPPGDTESFTPAPPDHGRPLRRMNAG